jgi:hypothetical protein
MTRDYIEIFINKWIQDHRYIKLVNIIPMQKVSKVKITNNMVMSVASLNSGTKNQVLYYNMYYKHNEKDIDYDSMIIHECGHMLDNHFNIVDNFDKLLNNIEGLDNCLKEIKIKTPEYSKKDNHELFAEMYRLYYYNELSNTSKKVFRLLLDYFEINKTQKR